ncbi:putative reverse transcriptase domain-containing protein [Tanacetum coccineum]
MGTIPTTIPTTILDTTPVITPPATQTNTPVIPTETPIIAPTIPPSPDYTPASPDYSPASDLESDPSKDPSSDHIPPLPAISPFLSSDDDTIDIDTPDTPPSPTHGTPFTEIRDHLSYLVVGKRVGPLPTHRLPVRHSTDHSSSDSSSEASLDFHLDASSDSSSRHPLSDHSSPDLPSTSAGPSHKRRRSPMTYVPALSPVSGALSPVRADLIPSPKRVFTQYDPFEDPSLESITTITSYLKCLSSDDEPQTLIHQIHTITTHGMPLLMVTVPYHLYGLEASSDIHLDASSDSSSRNPLSDHSSPNLPSTSAGPSRKRRRSPMAYVPALSPVFKALSLVRTDLIPSPKRVKDSRYLANVEVDPREISLRDDAMVRVNTLRDRGINARVVVEAIDRDETETGVRGPVEEGAVEATYETFRDLVQRMVGVESAVIALTEKIVKLERDNTRLRGTMPNTRSGASMTREEIEELVTRRVAKEMEARKAARTLEPLNENGDEQEGENGGNRNRGNGGNGNGGNGGNGHRNGNHGMNYGGFMPVSKEYTFQDFLKCKPQNFSGTEGVVGLTRWFEKMETVFNISNCPPKYQVKYATCTLQDSALTWWNSHKRTIGVEAAYAMNWVELMKLMTEVYCPRNEIQKMETELMVPDEEDRVERFIGGLPDNIQGNVIAASPARLQDAIRIANQLMDKKVQGYAARSAENKRRMETYTAGNNERRGYAGPLPYCNKCRLHHEGLCTMRCGNCKKVGHQTRDCRAAIAPNTQRAPKRNKNGNKTGNQTGGNETTARAYAIGGGGTNPDSNVVTGTFLLNNCYASMLFDSGADRSFVSTTFSALLDVTPTTLDTSYAVELADGRISETNIVLRGCTLGLLGHPFDIDLMPVELGSFDVIIGMDWLANVLKILVYKADLSDTEQPDEETENMSDKLSGLESLSVSPPEHRPDISVNDSEDDRSQKRMRGLKDIGIGGELKPSCSLYKRKRSQVAIVMEPDMCENYRNLNGVSGVEYNDVKQSLSNSSGDSSGRLFDVPYTGCEPNQTAGAAGANDINHIVIENGPSEWQHKGKRNLRVKTKNVQKILYPEVKIESDPIMDTVTAPQRLMPYRHSRFTVNPKYQSCVSYNDNDTISLYDVDIEFQASQLPQDIPYISLMSKSTRQRITGHSLLVEVLNDSVSHLSLIGSECISSSYELDGVDVEMVSEDSKKSKIRKLSSITCLKKQSETPKVKLGRGKYIRDKAKKRKRKALTGVERPSENGGSETGKFKRPDEVPACVPLKVVFSRIREALRIIS